MHRKFLYALLLLLTLSVHAQDVLTAGSGTAQSGGVALIPLSIRDRSGTALGIDAGGGNRIQGFAFKVLFPSELVASVTFSRAGVAAAVTPMFETALQGSGWSSCIVSFHEATNPIPFTLNAAAPGDAIGMLTVTMRNDAPPGSVAALRFDAPSAMLSNQAGTVQETVAAGNLELVNGSVTVGPPAAPTSLVATAISTAQVNIHWNAAGGADHYEVWRSSGGAFTLAGSPAAPALSDINVVANTTYLYHVRTIDSADEPSPFSNIDAATTIVFTDDPLTTLSTNVQAVHFTQLRTAVNAFRAAANLAPLAADGSIATNLLIRADHLTDLRTALDEARSAIGLSALTYADPTVTAATTIKATHVTELRNGVK
jgi:hypothetical protein